MTIQTFLGFLLKDMEKSDKENVEKDIYFMKNAADKMSQLLDDLLTISRVGRVVNNYEEFDYWDAVKDVLELLAGRISNKNATIRIAEKSLYLNGDKQRIYEVFQNLIDNALKFSNEGIDPVLDIGWEIDENQKYYIYVKDNGIGIDNRHIHKLFGLFEKLQPESEGTGIGLALVKRIIDIHGGKIWVESEGEGLGTIVKFRIENMSKEKVEVYYGSR